MIPTQKEVTKHVMDTIAVLKEFAKSEFDVNLDALTPIISFNDCNRLGCAGMRGTTPYMKLNLGAYVQFETIGYTEYRSLARYPVIGGFHTYDWKLSLEALVYHEFAHNIQFAIKYSNSKLKEKPLYFTGLGYHESGHGQFFQRIYRKLREKFLNHRIQLCYANPPRMFNRGESELVQTTRRAFAGDFTHKGTKVMYKGRVYTISEYKASNRKYPYIGTASCGAKLKMPLDYLLAHTVA